MKKIIIILTMLSGSCFASINPNAGQSYKSEYSEAEPEQSGQIHPVINEYVTTIEKQLEHDVALLNANCDNEIRDEKKRLLFKQCFEEQKKNLQNDIFKTATALTLMFIETNEDKQLVIDNFINTYQNQLIQIIAISNQLLLPSEPFKNVMIKLFNEILINSYKNIQIIIDGDEQKTKEMETIFLEITSRMDKISNGY